MVKKNKCKNLPWHLIALGLLMGLVLGMISGNLITGNALIIEEQGKVEKISTEDMGIPTLMLIKNGEKEEKSIALGNNQQLFEALAYIQNHWDGGEIKEITILMQNGDEVKIGDGFGKGWILLTEEGQRKIIDYEPTLINSN